MANTQRKVAKSRAPRVQISYDVETGDSQISKELPLVIGVMGEFTHNAGPLREQKFIEINKDNFNKVMAGMAPKAEIMAKSVLPGKEGLLAVELTFNSIEDFTPDNVLAQVEPLKKLLLLRDELSELRNRAASNDRLKDQLNSVLQNSADKNVEGEV